jgi:nucleotide-binding universal stress UspA family protein
VKERPPVKRILVCLDASSRVPRVLETALAIAQSSGAKLILFRAVGLPHDAHVPPEALAMSPNALVELWRRNAERDLGAIRATLPPDAVESVVVQVGSPWSAICATARELGVDLIAIGSHGYDPIDHVIGTTAAKVVNHADRSVLMIR